MRIAFVTQSYKVDFRECKLLCESIDRFAPDYEHFIFVNDEDYELFQVLSYGNHRIHRKSKCIPWYFFRFPFKVLDHYFWLSPFTVPMRGWIYQQVCKLAVFDVIGKGYDAVVNMDSEAVLIKPFTLSMIYRDGKFKLFRDGHIEYDPHQWQYIKAIQKFFKGSLPQKEMEAYQYMDITTVFVRENIEKMLAEISSTSFLHNWKIRLANTLKFSEFFTYGNYVVHKLKMEGHYLTDRLSTQFIQYDRHIEESEFRSIVTQAYQDPFICFLWIQKIRHAGNDSDIFFNEINEYLHKIWGDKNENTDC